MPQTRIVLTVSYTKSSPLTWNIILRKWFGDGVMWPTTHTFQSVVTYILPQPNDV
jgi:hypothetical protein